MSHTSSTATQAPAGSRAAEPAVPKTSSAGWLAARFAVIGVWVAMIVFFCIVRPDTFMTSGTVKTILGGYSQQTLVFLTAALLCTILVGEFVDMSIASNFGLSGTLVTVLNVNHGWNVWLAALVALLVSTLVGQVNGWLVVKVGVNTIVVTLGVGTLLLGIALWLSNLMPVSGLPVSFQKIAAHPLFGLPIGFYYGVVLMLGFATSCTSRPWAATCASSGRAVRSADSPASGSPGSGSAPSPSVACSPVSPASSPWPRPVASTPTPRRCTSCRSSPQRSSAPRSSSPGGSTRSAP